MTSRPRLKSITVHQSPGQVVIWNRSLRRVFIDDDSGAIAALLRILAEGRCGTDELPGAMTAAGFPVTGIEVEAVLAALDDLGVLEQSGGDESLDPAARARHLSNLRFYDYFAGLHQTSASFHRRAEQAHVLLLGAGGLGSGILQSLVGLGVGEVTLVDMDTVETKNLARQFVYGLSSVGRPKVDAARDWVESYSGGTTVYPLHRRIADVESIVDLGARADIVVCAIDSPDDIHLLVNEACFRLRTPYVVGGLSYSTLSYWSVDPGTTPCRRCLECHHEDELASMPEVLRRDPMIDPQRVNRATGPVVQVVSGLMTMEAMRYVTLTDSPIAAATYQVIELADHMAMSTAPWTRHARCALCAASGHGEAGQVGAGQLAGVAT